VALPTCRCRPNGGIGAYTHRMRPAVTLAALALLGGCAAPSTPATSDSVTSSAATTTAAATTSAPTRVTSPPAPRAAHTATHRPTATRTAAPTHQAAPTRTTPPARAVHPGAYCTPEGATGHTTAGTLMRCTRKAGETRARWRRA
jgi:hypothetical protein